MHWTEAVKASSVRMAVRQDHLGLGFGRLMIRHADGTGEIELMPSARRQSTEPLFRLAERYEVSGFTDWSPAQTQADCYKRGTS